jgi:hypothetical protein
MDERTSSFLQSNHSAIMVTICQDGTPHVAASRKIWTSTCRRCATSSG